MASQIGNELKNLLKVTSKSRLDSKTDQYNRIFMVKLFMMSTIIMAVSWYSDKMNCIIPKSNEIGNDFVSSSCWIQGIYVYEEMIGKVKKVGYFGMPKDMDDEGILKTSRELCHLRPKLGVPKSPDCKAMTKTFFLQYQYMPFLVGAMAILYYLPYIAFRLVNKDKQLLKDAIKNRESNLKEAANRQKDVEKIKKDVAAIKEDVADIKKDVADIKKDASDLKKDPADLDKDVKDTTENPAEKIVTVHLRRNKMEMTKRVILNIIIKSLYILSNFLTFIWLNDVLNYKFIEYGSEFVMWSRLNNTLQYDYMGRRHHPKPGNYLLPPFGYCEVHESSRDVKTTVANTHKFVCEVSQHTLYQYCLLVLWFGIVVGFVVSTCGFLHLMLTYSYLLFKCDFKRLHIRQLELLDYIRNRDKDFYDKCRHILLEKDTESEDSIDEHKRTSCF